MTPKIFWPDGKRFAFTIFDDPDSQVLETGRPVYSILSDLGFRTTKAVWPIYRDGVASDHGSTCADPKYRQWVEELQADGFEIGFHNATSHTSERDETIRGLREFEKVFGGSPTSMANHYFCAEQIYWGASRVTGGYRALYNALTLGRARRTSFGHVPEHPYFWGDLCKQHIKYVRNFAYADVNTLRACPQMPYHDRLRPYVNYWFACSEGSKLETFAKTLSEANQDQLEKEGGACIMYTHFAHGFCGPDGVNQEFIRLMKRLSRMNGWFVPVSVLLDYLLEKRGAHDIGNAERRRLERRWLAHKIRFGRA